MSDLAARRTLDVHVPTLIVLAHSQRIRAIKFRGLAACYICPGEPDGIPGADVGDP